jgi:hypothetical protein
MWVGWVRWSYELAGLLTIAGFLIFDRVRLFQEYLTKYIDEDQGIQWYAAREFLRGHVHEPCFFGQSYNSNVEGMLAAPLAAVGLPYEIAVPLVTVLLGLVPFLAMGWVAWRRKQPVVAGLAMLLPVALSTRYGVITGMPRGFVTGVAAAIIPALLYLPAFRKKLFVAVVRKRRLGEGWWGRAISCVGRLFVPPPVELRRSYPKARYFFAAFFAVVAVMFNPNCAVLLAGVAVYGVVTTWREWRFWVFTVLGLIAAAPYPLLVYYFYYRWHDDYRLYQRYPPKNFDWSWDNYHEFVQTLSDLSFHDLVPDPVYRAAATALHSLHGSHPQMVTTWMVRNPASVAVMAGFGVAVLFLAARLRVAAVLGAAAAIGLVFVSFAYSRIQDGRSSASFPYSRMFLAVPVVWVWLLMLINSPRTTVARRRGWVWWQWTRRWVFPAVGMVALLACVVSAGVIAVGKNKALAEEVKDINGNAQVARPVSIEETERIAKAIQAAADKEHLSFVLIVGFDGRKWDYSLPEMTSCETLFPAYERRTWRMVEECYPRYDKILVLGNMPGRGSTMFRSRSVVQRDPPLTLVSMNGQSVETFCREMNIRWREFERPNVPKAPVPPAAPAATRPGRPTPPSTRPGRQR